MRTIKKIKNGIHITVTELNEPSASEEAIYEFRKALTKIMAEKGLLYRRDNEENEQSEEG